MGKGVMVGSPEWARFEDWFSAVVGKYQDWTVVAEFQSLGGLSDSEFFEVRATLAYLAAGTRECVEKVFDHDSWDVQYDLGGVHLDETDRGVVCHEDVGDENRRVFITRRQEIGSFPAYWRFWPTLEQYFDLRYDDGGNLVDPYSGELVAEIPFPADKGPVRVRTDYLQHYLAARQMLLIRQHDHRRCWKELIPGIAEWEGDCATHLEKWGCWRLDVSNSRDDPWRRFSRVVAKDVVIPHDVAGSVGGVRPKKVNPEDLPEFVTRKGLNGVEERRKPDPDDILYPTFFNPKVLKRYYDEPSRYSVSFASPGFGGVSFLDKWSIAIGRNEEGLIVLWLGDLVKRRLPYEEIVHWHVYNVPQRGGMAQDFWNQQMEMIPPGTPSVEKRLIDSRYHLNKEVESRGKKIFRDYEGPDQLMEKTLRIPLFEEHSEFREAVMIVARVFVEYLDIGSFKAELTDEFKKDPEGRELGQFQVLCNWLQQVLGVPKSVAMQTMKALQGLQMVRSRAGVAHRFSDRGYGEVAAKLGLSGSITGRKLFLAAAEPLAEALEALMCSLGVGNKV